MSIGLLQIQSGTFPPNIIKIGQQSTFDLVRPIAERKRVPFFETQCRWVNHCCNDRTV